MKRIGVLGGTFDPIHYGHLLAAEAARATLDLDRVLFIPCRQPPHKDPATTTEPEHRYRMTVLGTTGYPHFRVSRLEMDRPGPSYTVDTLSQLRERYGSEAELYFIVGADAFLQFPSWKSPLQVIELARIVVVSRPGYDERKLAAVVSSLPDEQRQRVQYLPIVSVQISAHELRRQLRAGRSVRYYVPPTVLTYIEQYGLYQA